MATPRLKVGLIGGTAGNWPSMICEAKGWHKENDIQLVYFKTEQEAIDMILNGNVPIIKIGADIVIPAIAKGEPIRIVGDTFQRAIGGLFGRRAYRTLDELKGKTVGLIHEKYGTTLFLRDLLLKRDLKKEDIHFKVAGKTPERYKSLVAGEIDAAILAPPFSFKAIEEGFVCLIELAESYPKMACSSIHVRSDFAMKHRNEVVKYLLINIKGHRWLQNSMNRAEAIDILTDRSKIDRRYASQTYDELIVDKPAYTSDGALNLTGLNTLLQCMKKVGESAESEYLEKYVDEGLIKEALEMMDKNI